MSFKVHESHHPSLKNIPPQLALTGRVKNWLESPEARCPASCTVFNIEPTLEGKEGIQDAWLFTSKGLRFAAGVAINLSDLKNFGSHGTELGQISVVLNNNHDDWDSFVKVAKGDTNGVTFAPAPPLGLAPFNTYIVQDSMEGECGIESSWLELVNCILTGKSVTFDLSNLRSAGTENGKGLTSSGAGSFAKFYPEIVSYLEAGDVISLCKVLSLVNQELRRGGAFKNGAVTIYTTYNNDFCEEFLDLAVEDIKWIKRAVYVDEGVRTHPIKEKLAEAVDKGYVWLAKIQYDSNGNRLYSNVCLEILLKSRGTCLLSHINAGLLKPKEIPMAYEQAMEYLCNLHKYTNVDGEGFYYLPKEEDRQVGLGVIGLASHLAINGVTYQAFVDELEALEKATNGYQRDKVLSFCPCSIDEGDSAKEIAYYFAMGFVLASDVAKKHNMERAFTVAPTATCFQKHEDLEGYSVTPEISAPVAREIERASETFGIIEYDFNPRVETAYDVGWDTQWRLLNAWQRLMDSTGLGHSISANIWSSQYVTPDWIDTFLDSDIKTTYYRTATQQYSNDKSRILDDETIGKMAAVYEDVKAKESEPRTFTSFQQIMDEECSACSGS